MRDVRVSLSVLAIVINKEISLDPSKIQFLGIREMPSFILIPPVLSSSGDTWRVWILPLARIQTEVFVRGYEWGLVPIRLLQTASCGPIICIPYTREQVHGLLIWVEIVVRFPIVFVHPDWNSINKEPACRVILYYI